MLSRLEGLVRHNQKPPIPDSFALAKTYLLEYKQRNNTPFTIQSEPRMAMDIHAHLTPRQIALFIMQGLISRDFPIPSSKDS